MPIETTNYMLLGFAVAFVTIGLHLVSFPLRTRNLKADLQALETVPKASAKATGKKVVAKKAAAKMAAPKKAEKKAAKKVAKKTAKKTTKKTARR